MEMENFFAFGGIDNNWEKDTNANNNNNNNMFGKNAGLFDQDGFPMTIGNSTGAHPNEDPFAISSFDNDFPQDTFHNSSDTMFGNSVGSGESNLLPPSTKDSAKRKKGSTRRSSLGGSGSKSPTDPTKSKKKEVDIKLDEKAVRKRK